MKIAFAPLVLVLALIALSVPARAQSVDLKTVLGPNNTFHDPVFGVSLRLPAGWAVTSGQRWGKDNGENTFSLRAIWPSDARPALYYQRFRPDHPRPTDFVAYYTDAAARKAASRTGYKDYRNLPETFEVLPIAGQPGCRYAASFTVGGRTMIEYFVRISGPTTQVMFFTTGTENEINHVRAEIDRMAETVKVP